MPNPEHPVDKTAVAAAQILQKLDPGGLAEVRRMEPETAAPGFWRLVARYPDTINQGYEQWVAIVRILAILTPKGDPSVREPLHNAQRRLGAVLCDGGDPEWPPSIDSRPMLSERRLAQLMAARGSQKNVLLERAARALARTRRPGSGINVCEIAWTLLDSGSGGTGRRLAEPYYRRLDGANNNRKNNQEGAE